MIFLQKRLKETRIKLGLTQVQAAEKLGMKQTTYQKIESGTTGDIRISTLYHICKTFDISADWLLGLGEHNLLKYVTPNFDSILEEIKD